MTVQRIGRARRVVPARTVQDLVDRVVEDRCDRTAPDLRRQLAEEFREASGGAVPPGPWLTAVSDEAVFGHRYVIGRPDPPQRVVDPPLRLGWDLVRPWPWTDPEPAEHGPELVDDQLPAHEEPPSWAPALAWALVALVIFRAWARRGRPGARRWPS